MNEGAKVALVENNKSLLPIGIVALNGEFEGGDVISILDDKGIEIARGVSNYSSDDTKKILGVHSDKIREILGFHTSDDIISKDNLVVL